MERDWPEQPNDYERLDEDLSEPDPADMENADSDLPRRDRISSVIESIEPTRPRREGEAVYADTDMNPNAQDQRDEHSGEGLSPRT